MDCWSRLVTHLEEHGELVAPPWDVHETVLVGHLRLRSNAFFKVHQAVVILARLQHALLVVRLGVFVTLAACKTSTYK